MKRRIILGLLILSMFLVSGCTTIIYYSEGIVSYNNSLEEAYNKCATLCDEKWGYRATPRLDECVEKECQCLC